MVFDCATYHIGFHPDVDDESDVRFDPLKTGRPELVQRLIDLGCDEPTVLHTVMSKTKSDMVDESIIKMAVTINSDEKTRRGKNGEVARLPELQAAAHAWLVEHSPNTLMDDIEYKLSAYGIRIIWNVPNYSWGDLIEYCWSQSKDYADAMYFKGRTMVELAEHIHEGVYTGKVARPGMSYIKGGNFVLDVDSGECDSARNIFEHGFHSLDTHNPGAADDHRRRRRAFWQISRYEMQRRSPAARGQVTFARVRTLDGARRACT